MKTFLLAAVFLAASGAAAQPVVSTIAGRVSNPDGTPRPGAPVFAAVPAPPGAPAAGADRDFTVVAETISEWDGRYVLTGLPAGQYVVGARAGRGGPASLYPSVPDAPPRRITVLEGVPAEGIDVWLQPAAERYTVSGRVHWPEARTIDNLAIEYNITGDSRLGLWYVFDPGGLFSIEGASAGTMVLLARADSALGPLIGLATTDVSGPVEEVRITLAPPGTIEGRVVPVRPLPSGAGPLRVGLRQTLLRVSPLYPAEGGAVEGDGRFRVPDVRGQYEFEIQGLPPGWRIQRIRRDGRDVVNDRVRVGPGEEVRGLELVVGP